MELFGPEHRDLKFLSQLVHSNVFESKEDLETSPWFDDWKQSIEHFIDQEVKWHHHMLFPTCVLNEHSPNWVLAVEGKNESSNLIKIFPAEPVAEFIQIEKLVWNS